MIELCELVWVTVIGTRANGTATGTATRTAIGTGIRTTGGTGRFESTKFPTDSKSTSVIIVIISSFIAIVLIVVFVTTFVVVLCIFCSKKLSSKFTPAEAIYDLPGEREPEPFQMTPSDAYGKTITREPYIMSTCSAYEL